MKIGFAKNDLTPPVGGELAGFGPFIRRTSRGIRDRLWARAMAVEHDGVRLVVVCCDLIGAPLAMTDRVRSLVAKRVGLREQAVIVACSHTHSGPNTSNLVGWGESDPAYVEFLPYRVAKACVEAFANLQEAELAHAEVPCEGIGINREREKATPPLEEVLDHRWRPSTPEWTDATCHVLRVTGADGLLGFVSHFGCHPVVCCENTRLIHGDFCGVATNALERENPGAIGLFVQGAHGDVNACVTHQPEIESMLALDVIAARYANAVRTGIEKAETTPVDGIDFHTRVKSFPRAPFDEETLIEKLNGVLAKYDVDSSNETLAGPEARRDAVLINSLRRMIRRLENNQPLTKPEELVGVRLGPIRLIGSGFETYQAIKNDVLANAPEGVTLVASLVNDVLGYACDRDAVQGGGYANDFVPFIIGVPPMLDPQGELAEGLLNVWRELGR